MKNRILYLLATPLLLALGAGCAHSQLPPTPGYNTVWTWTAPSPCSGCTYVVSTLSVAAGTASCPASTGSNYTPQQTVTTGVSGTTWTQTNTTSLTVCAVAQTIQGGNTSPASTQSSPVVNPSLPSAPGVPSGNSTVAALAPPLMPNMPAPDKQMASAMPIQIVGHVVRR
jgi:hypothetical protein